MARAARGTSCNWSGHGGHHKAVQVVEHRTSQELPQCPGISIVGSTQRVKVPGSIPLVHDGWWIAESNKDQVEEEATRPSIAIEKWVDSFEMTVGRRQHLDGTGGPRNAADICDPFAHRGRDFNPRGWSSFRSETGQSRAPAPLPPLHAPSLLEEEPTSQTSCIAMWCTWRISVKVEDISVRPAIAPQTLAIDPLGCVGITAHFQVFGEFIVPDRPSLRQERLNLFEHQGVALNGSRVMGFFVPDGGPDALGFDGVRKSSEALPHLSDGRFEALVDLFPAGTRHEAP